MNRMIFINLPVADLDATKSFYTGLGFALNEEMTDEDAACIVVSETIYVMALTRSRFGDFVVGEVGDPAAGPTVINCLSTENRAEVDDLVAKALANGGRSYREPMDEGFMYGHSFADPDGHVWEVMFMEMPA
ncbi:MAG TPA: VOC family protein [Propionibacteriaceae bacterium]